MRVGRLWSVLLAANRRLSVLPRHLLGRPLLLAVRGRAHLLTGRADGLLLRRERSRRKTVTRRRSVTHVHAITWWWRSRWRSVSHPISWHRAGLPWKAMCTAWALEAWVLLELIWRRAWVSKLLLLLLIIGRLRPSKLILVLVLWRLLVLRDGLGLLEMQVSQPSRM